MNSRPTSQTAPLPITTTRPRLTRSIAAVALGFVLTGALSVGMDLVLHAVGIYPPWGQVTPSGLLLLATLYRIVFTVFGGGITARLAPNRPMKHVVVLGTEGTLAALIGAVGQWNARPHLRPYR